MSPLYYPAIIVAHKPYVQVYPYRNILHLNYT